MHIMKETESPVLGACVVTTGMVLWKETGKLLGHLTGL